MPSGSPKWLPGTQQVAAANRGQGAQQALASVLGYVGAVAVEPACRHIPVDRSAVGPDGTISDAGFAAGLAEIWTELARQAGQNVSGLPFGASSRQRGHPVSGAPPGAGRTPVPEEMQ